MSRYAIVASVALMLSTPAFAQLDDAEVVSQTFPESMVAGSSFTAKVTVRNTGTATWTRAKGHKLGAVGDSDPFRAGLSVRVRLPDGVSVKSGATWTFAIKLVAPAAPGTYLTDWRMVREGVRWFGQVASANIRVTRGAVDPNTIVGKHMFGYQGWFSCPGDGSPHNAWVHWFQGNPPPPDAGHLKVDFWPDTRELGPTELFDTDMRMIDGRPARLYSAWNATSVDRHFRWMADNDLDGVYLQRFSAPLTNSRHYAFRNQVASNVRAGAEAHGRVFSVMYDISGEDEATFVQRLKSDWSFLVGTLGLTQSSRYLRHDGRPVLVIWGLGFNDRPGTAAQAADLIRWFQADAPASERATLMGGVPAGWRTLTLESKTDPAWASVYRSFDIVSPWTVGRYADDAGADSYKNSYIVPDLLECGRVGALYMPVVFPGFSWANMYPGSPSNQIPRRGGRFYWRQAYNAVTAGCPAIYAAMYDEVDEGTAFYKTAENVAAQPVGAALVPLDIDGYALPSDWYLKLADRGGRMLRGEIAPTPNIESLELYAELTAPRASASLAASAPEPTPEAQAMAAEPEPAAEGASSTGGGSGGGCVADSSGGSTTLAVLFLLALGAACSPVKRGAALPRGVRGRSTPPSRATEIH